MAREENRTGYHHPQRVNEEKGGSGQGRMEPPNGGRAGMKEPTNHAGHTHEMARRHESDARIEAHRAVHAGKGQRDHERILHDTHKLHQGPFTSHGSKHGESHHLRNEESPAHERRESKAEREREGE
jgi:hypothetical protein